MRPVNYEEKRRAVIARAVRNHQVRSYDKETRTVTDMEGNVRAPAKQDRLVGDILPPASGVGFQWGFFDWSS